MFLAGIHRARYGISSFVTGVTESYESLCVFCEPNVSPVHEEHGVLSTEYLPQFLLYFFYDVIFSNPSWSQQIFYDLTPVIEWKCCKWLEIMKHLPNLILWNVIKNECNLSEIIQLISNTWWLEVLPQLNKLSHYLFERVIPKQEKILKRRFIPYNIHLQNKRVLLIMSLLYLQELYRNQNQFLVCKVSN